MAKAWANGEEPWLKPHGMCSRGFDGRCRCMFCPWCGKQCGGQGHYTAHWVKGKDGRTTMEGEPHMHCSDELCELTNPEYFKYEEE